MSDITELKKAISESNLKVQYLSAVPSPLFVIDKNFNVMYTNDVCAKILGATPDSLIGKKCYSLLKTGDCNTDKCASAVGMKNKRGKTSETLAHIGDKEVYIQYTAKPLYDEAGEVKGAIEVIMDISRTRELMKSITEICDQVYHVSSVVEDLSKEILGSSNKIHGDGTELAATAEELARNMKQVQKASQSVSEGAQNLSGLTQKTARNVEDTVKVLAGLNGKTEEVDVLVNSSDKLAAFVGENGKSVLESLEEIKKSTKEVESTITQVNASVENVAGLANDISEIAGQVNMLALNAAIEAARAGEAGRGFAVVADAVKQLAGKTRSAAKTAVESINQISGYGANAVNLAQKAGGVAEKGGTVVSGAVKGSQDVADSMSKVLLITKAFGTDVSQSVKALEEVNVAIQQVASISEESAAAAEETTSSLEEQSAATEKVMQSAQNVQKESQNAVELSQKIVEEINRLKEELQKVKTSS